MNNNPARRRYEELVIKHKFQQLINETGLSLAALARFTGYSKATVYAWSHGSRNVPSEVMDKLAQYAAERKRIFD